MPKSNPILNLINKVAEEFGFKPNTAAVENKPDTNSQVQEVDPVINDIKLSLDQVNLELTSYKEQLKTLREQYQRQDAQSRELVKETATNTLKELFTQAAPPCAMLVSQQHLHSQGKTASTEDVLLVAQQLLHVLVDNGLVLFATPGQIVRFNQNKHVAANFDEHFEDGDSVKILSPGAEFDGYILQRAHVQSVS